MSARRISNYLFVQEQFIYTLIQINLCEYRHERVELFLPETL